MIVECLTLTHMLPIFGPHLHILRQSNAPLRSCGSQRNPCIKLRHEHLRICSTIRFARWRFALSVLWQVYDVFGYFMAISKHVLEKKVKWGLSLFFRYLIDCCQICDKKTTNKLNANFVNKPHNIYMVTHKWQTVLKGYSNDVRQIYLLLFNGILFIDTTYIVFLLCCLYCKSGSGS